MKLAGFYNRKFHMVARIIFAIENMIVASAAFSLGFYVTSSLDHSAPVVDGLWAVISGIMVWEPTPRRTLKAVKIRVAASFIGASIAAAYLLLFDFTIFGLAVCVFTGTMFNYTINFQRGIKATAIAICVIL